MQDVWHIPTWDSRLGNADVWLLENVVRRTPYFHGNGTAKLTTSLHSIDLMRRLALIFFIWFRLFLLLTPYHRPMMARQIYK